jgi:hypothetical protein
MAQRLDIGIVSIGSGSAEDEEVSTTGAKAHPLECGIEIFAASDERKPRLGAGFHVSGTTDPEILIRLRLGKDGYLRADDEKQGQHFCRAKSTM